MPNTPGVEILRAGARALARHDGLEPTLPAFLHPLADQLGIASAAVFTVPGQHADLEIAATMGLGTTVAATGTVRPSRPR
jgi:hypothetical protein